MLEMYLIAPITDNQFCIQRYTKLFKPKLFKRKMTLLITKANIVAGATEPISDLCLKKLDKWI